MQQLLLEQNLAKSNYKINSFIQQRGALIQEGLTAYLLNFLLNKQSRIV